MTRRFTIPRYVWWLVALATICIGGTFVMWAAHMWTPVQRHYLWTYVWCSRPGADSSSQVTIRWLYKTSPGRESELASENEIISGASSDHSLAFSPAARHEGWAGLVLGPKERYPAAMLRPFLERQFFDSNNAWIVVSLPLFCGLAVFCFLILGVAWLESRLRYVRWQLEQTSWFKPTLNWFRKWLAAAVKLYFRLIELTAHRTRKTTPEETPVSPPIMPRAKPVQPTFSPFGATNRTQKSAFTWSKKDEIE